MILNRLSKFILVVAMLQGCGESGPTAGPPSPVNLPNTPGYKEPEKTSDKGPTKASDKSAGKAK
jgi:hypothetical protein